MQTIWQFFLATNYTNEHEVISPKVINTNWYFSYNKNLDNKKNS